MNKFSYFAILGTLTLVSCSDLDIDSQMSQVTKENAENLFGLIDPNQDWSNVSSCTVSVTANASLNNIVKVQILTESPFFNDQAKVLAEADATNGQTVTLDYDAPKINSRVIAACVDNNGNYYIKGFNVGDQSVSFNNTASLTRATGATRATSSLPDLSAVELDFTQSFKSYNAIRSEKNSTWTGKNWENDRLWQPTGSVSSNGWKMSNSVIYRNATELSEEDSLKLEDIFQASLYRYDGTKARNNLKLINESSIVQLYGNHLESNGKAALTLCPVQLASTEAYWCSIYYYYYKTEDIPAGTTEADYIKSLPKFKAIDLNAERQAFSAKSGIDIDGKDASFYRLHEYILPFYGNASEFTLKSIPATLGSHGYTTDGKFYRISNYSGNSGAKPNPIPASNHYLTYGTKTENLKDEYTDNIEYQLWQIFTNTNDNTVMLYNVGSKNFLWWNNGDYVEIKDITENSLKNYTVYITDGAKNPVAFNDITKQKVFILSAYKNNFIKALIDTNREYLFKGGTNVSGSYGIAREWTFEEYKASSATAITDFVLPSELYPSTLISQPSAKPSAIIPEGYRIGFMIRKNGGDGVADKTYTDKQGCLYGYGELNTEINTYGQFKTAVSKYGMELNSPRMATFTANNKVYLCFEEGADTQYSDVIVEIGSEGDTGVYMFDDVPEVNNLPYTMCFEDRPYEADYDMNDVVLRCIRMQKDKVQLSLIATGASDKVQINGIPGELIGGTDLNGKEVHELFGMGDAEGDDRYINTKANDQYKVTGIAGTYKVPETMTIPQFLSKIYITNMTKGGDIRIPKKGEAPYALIIPGDFNYPNEGVCINNAYEKFRNWANNASQYNEWIYWAEEEKTYENPSK